MNDLVGLVWLFCSGAFIAGALLEAELARRGRDAAVHWSMLAALAMASALASLVLAGTDRLADVPFCYTAGVVASCAAAVSLVGRVRRLRLTWLRVFVGFVALTTLGKATLSALESADWSALFGAGWGLAVFVVWMAVVLERWERAEPSEG